jgi:hypothetical protein
MSERSLASWRQTTCQVTKLRHGKAAAHRGYWRPPDQAGKIVGACRIDFRGWLFHPDRSSGSLENAQCSRSSIAKLGLTLPPDITAQVNDWVD